MLKLRICVFALGFVLAGQPLLAAKLALVAGNQAYAHLPPPDGTLGDAQDMAAALERLGFTVTLLTDAGSAAFDAAVDRLAGQAGAADTVVFYYAGYAVQLNGQNHLLPVSADVATAQDLTDQAWPMDRVVGQLQSGEAQVLIFLDASRRTPVQAKLQTKEGLAQIETSAGTFVSFAARPGAASYDRAGRGRNSAYTGALLSRLEDRGLSISDLMIWVRKEVRAMTVGRQTPWEQSSLRAQFYFSPADGGLPQFETVPGTTIIGVAEADPPPAPLPDDLPRAVQAELSRLGCYTLRVDGQWGRGSRSAASRYYKAAGAEQEGLDPTAAFYRRLLDEPDGLCPPPAAPVRTRARSSGGGTAQKPASPAKPAPKAEEPARKSSGCTVFGVAVSCLKDG